MASTDARPVPRKNTAYRHYFAIRDTAGALVTTWAGQDTELSKDGGNFGDATNEATEIQTSGVGYIDLTAAEMNYDCVIVKVTVTNANALTYVVILFPEEVGDIRTDKVYLADGAHGGSSCVLTLKQLVAVNNEGPGFSVYGATCGFECQGANGAGFNPHGSDYGIYAEADAGHGIAGVGAGANGDGFYCIGPRYDINGDIHGSLSGSVDSVTTVVALADSEDVYHADIFVTIDAANSKDEYTAIWFKNGVRVTSGIASPLIQVVKRADGTDLIEQTEMIQIGTIGSYKYDESTNRLTAGEAAVAVVTATIDSSARSFAAVVSRDSSS